MVLTKDTSVYVLIPDNDLFSSFLIDFIPDDFIQFGTVNYQLYEGSVYCSPHKTDALTGITLTDLKKGFFLETVIMHCT